jgi:hypothetical protein
LVALECHDLHQFIKPLSEMSHAVLSEDESDHEYGTNLGQARYAIVKEDWRSDELIKWLRTMDLLACGVKWKGRNVAHQGNSRCLRVISSRSKGRKAVSGLPENCYDPGWLNSLSDFDRMLLNVQPPLNVNFDETIRSCAFIFPLSLGLSYT